MADRTDNGGKLRILTVIDEYSRECLALHAARKLTAHDLVEVMERRVAERGAPAHMRSDNGSEFIARILQGWLAEHKVKTLYIEPGSPWQNGHVESFNGSLRDECLDRELMLSVAEARVLIDKAAGAIVDGHHLAAAQGDPRPVDGAQGGGVAVGIGRIGHGPEQTDETKRSGARASRTTGVMTGRVITGLAGAPSKDFATAPPKTSQPPGRTLPSAPGKSKRPMRGTGRRWFAVDASGWFVAG